MITVLVALLICVATISLGLPYGLPLFTPLVLLTVAVAFIRVRQLKLKVNAGLFLLIGCAGFYLWGMVISGKTYQHTQADLVNLLAIAPLILVFATLGSNRYSQILTTTRTLVLFATFSVGVLGLYKFTLMMGGVTLDWVVRADGQYPIGTSLVHDYNMFAYSMFIGLAAALSSVYATKSMLVRGVSWVAIPIFVSAVVFAGSRRAWLLLLFLTATILATIAWRFVVRGRGFSPRRAVVFLTLFALIGAVVTDVVGANLDSPAVERLLVRSATLTGETATLGDTASARTSIWAGGASIISSYSVRELLTGRGFDYLNAYPDIIGVPDKESYPHNPVISATHYSGLLGTLVLLLLILWVSNRVIAFRGVFGPFFVASYFISLYFLLPASNSIFSVKLLLFLTVMVIASPPLLSRPAAGSTRLPLGVSGNV